MSSAVRTIREYIGSLLHAQCGDETRDGVAYLRPRFVACSGACPTRYPTRARDTTSESTLFHTTQAIAEDMNILKGHELINPKGSESEVSPHF